MKTRLSIIVLLSVISVALVVSVAGAQPPITRPTDQGYTVYLPIVTACAVKVTAFASAYPPVVRVGETVTLTGSIVNECARLVGEPSFGARIIPVDVLSVTHSSGVGHYSVPIGGYRTLTLTLLAVGPGAVTIHSGMIYEAVNDEYPSMYYWDSVAANPIVVRVMPNPSQGAYP